MSVVKHFIEDSIKKTEIDEFLQSEFERAGYGGVSITKTPLGTHLVIYTMRPGMVIGRGGETIRALATILEEKFQLPSPQISVAEIEIPELNAYVVASRIASALKRGVHYRRAGFWGLNQTMAAGALGAEIIISGKLRTDRARYEKFRTGYLPKSGEPPRKYMRKAELHVHLKPGTLGVKVRLIPPDAQFPDQVQVHVIEEELESEPEKIIAEEKPVEPAASVEETVEETKPEPTAPPVTEEKIEAEKKPAKKPAKAEVPATKPKAVKEKKAAKPKAATKKKATKSKAKPKKKPAAKKEKAKPKAASADEKPAAKKKAKKKAAEPVASVSKEKAVTKKKATKKAAPVAEKKAAPKKKVAKTKVSSAAKKATPKKKVAKPKKKATPAKKKVTKKKSAKAKAPSAEEKKEAGK
jgi:small subunit ribosomal protein S3